MAQNINFIITANNVSAINSIKQIQSSASDLKKSMSGMIGTFSHSLIAVGQIGKFISSGMAQLREAADFEKTIIQLKPFVDGIGDAREMMVKFREESANGTASIEEMAAAARVLAGVFKTQGEIETWVGAMHNLSAATGRSIGEISSAFAKAKAGSPVTGMLDQLLIYRQLAEQMGVNEATLKQLISTGKIGFPEIEAAILACATGTGVFAKAAGDLSNTFSGTLATIDAKLKIVKSDLAENVMLPSLNLLTYGLEKYKRAMEQVGLFSADPMNYTRNRALLEEEQAVKAITAAYAAKRKEIEREFATITDAEELRLRRIELTNEAKKAVADNEWKYSSELLEIELKRADLARFIGEQADKRLAVLNNQLVLEKSIVDEKEKAAAIGRAQNAKENYGKLIETQALSVRDTSEQLDYLVQKAGGNSTQLRDLIYELKEKNELTKEENETLSKTLEYYNKIVSLERQLTNEKRMTAEQEAARKASFEEYKLNLQIQELTKNGNIYEAQKLRLLQRQNELKRQYGELAIGYAERELALEQEKAQSTLPSLIEKYNRQKQVVEPAFPQIKTSFENLETRETLGSLQNRVAAATEASARLLEKIEQNTRTNEVFNINTTLN